MEDDAIGLLQEWIAYHYTKLPLRRLIVANDPRARTTPTEILQRWNGRIDITEWTDKDYFPVTYRSAIMNKPFNSTAEVLTTLHRFRQRFFYFKCMRQLKRENRTFVAMIDSDEFLNAPNPNWKYNSLLHHPKNFSSSSQEYNLPVAWTVLEFLKRLRGHQPTSMPCISVPRLLFGAKDATALERRSRQWYIPQKLESELSLDVNDFVTLRWLWHGTLDDTTSNKAGKALVDVSRIPYTSMVVEQADPHRPVRDFCSQDGVWIRNVDSALIVHHYIGTYEQWSFRSDPRTARTRDRFDVYKNLSSSIDYSITPWIEYFLREVGPTNAKKLLKGVGQLQVVASDHDPHILSDKIYAGLVRSNITNVTVTISA